MLLAHYDPALLIKMAGDASAYGIGIVISHVFPEGTESSITLASRTLSTLECTCKLKKKPALVNGIQNFGRTS